MVKNLIVAPVTQLGNLYLGAIPVKTDAPPVAVKQPRHLMFVVDKSGSMYSTLPRLIDDVKRLVRGLDTGDALTFAWFSSKGECGFPIKAFRIVDENSFAELDRLFDSHKQAQNLTCFSEVLGNIELILSETAFLNTRNHLTFFSDGWANSPNVSSEHEKCREIMKSLSGKFDLVLTVAYSDYADRDFLTELATLAGGEGISASDLRQFTESFERFIRRTERSVPRIPVDLEDLTPEFVFSIDTNPETGGTTSYEPDENNVVHLAPIEGKSEQFLYFLSEETEAVHQADLDGNGVDLQRVIQFSRDLPREEILSDGFKRFLANWTELEKRADLLTAAFASAVVLSQKGHQDDAIEVLGFLGDERLVKMLGNAYTPTEKANVEDEIRHTLFNASERWRDGVNFDCVPDADAFCLLNLLDILLTDSQARFHSRHPAFRYKKIGRKGIQRPGYPDFLPDAGASSPISDLVWNSEFLNLSIRAKISGSVELPDSITVDSDGKLSPEGKTVITRPETLSQIFPSFIYRTYAVVKDGFLNVQKFPVEVSASNAYLLWEKGVFAGEQEPTATALGVLHLDKIPVINRRIAEKTPTAKSLAENVYADEVLGAQIKVLKALRLELDPKNEVVSRSEVAELLKRSVPAIKRRLYDLGQINSKNRWGLTLHAAGKLLGIGSHVIQKYLDYGFIPYFRGNKCIYINPADLLEVREIDWTKFEPSPELESMIRRALMQRAAKIIRFGADWRNREIYKFQKIRNYCAGRIRNPRQSAFAKEIPEAPNELQIGDWVTLKERVRQVEKDRRGIVKGIFYSPQKQPRVDGTKRNCWIASVEFPKIKRLHKDGENRIKYNLPLDVLEKSEPYELEPVPLKMNPEAVRSRRRRASYDRRAEERFEQIKTEIT